MNQVVQRRFVFLDLAEALTWFQPAIVAPIVADSADFAADRVPHAVDLEAMAQLTDWLCSTRVSALFPVSGMGQWRQLDRSEKENTPVALDWAEVDALASGASRS